MGKALNASERQATWLAFSLCGIAVLHLIFFFTDWYTAFYPFDMLMHFLGGAWIAALSHYFLFVQGRVSATGRLYEAIILIACAILVGVLWEFHEFLADALIVDSTRIMQTSVIDTMSDLFFDLLGATMTVILRYTHFLWKNHSL